MSKPSARVITPSVESRKLVRNALEAAAVPHSGNPGGEERRILRCAEANSALLDHLRQLEVVRDAAQEFIDADDHSCFVEQVGDPNGEAFRRLKAARAKMTTALKAAQVK
jgi:hypothetical protein